MKKYFLIIKNTLEEILTYRLNFTVWRARSILIFITTYFLWFALIPSSGKVLGYTQQAILTYVLGSAFLGSLIFTSKVWEVGDQINNGILSNLLVKPIHYFSYWFARSIGDKAMNVVFSITEITLLIFLLHPKLTLQMHPIVLFLCICSLCIAVILHFIVDFLLSSFAFWMHETWPLRFLFYNLLPFFSGSVFPLDILPKPIFSFFQILPFNYFVYFPLKIYLGQLTAIEISIGFAMSIFWVGVLYKSLTYLWNKGLRTYTSEGK